MIHDERGAQTLKKQTSHEAAAPLETIAHLRHLVRLSPRALGQLGQLGPSGPWRSRGEKHGMLSPKVIGVNMIKTMWGPCFLIAKLVNITSIALVHECL